MGQVAADLFKESHDSALFLLRLTRFGTPRFCFPVNIKSLLPLVSTLTLFLTAHPIRNLWTAAPKQ